MLVLLTWILSSFLPCLLKIERSEVLAFSNGALEAKVWAKNQLTAHLGQLAVATRRALGPKPRETRTLLWSSETR